MGKNRAVLGTYKEDPIAAFPGMKASGSDLIDHLKCYLILKLVWA